MYDQCSCDKSSIFWRKREISLTNNYSIKTVTLSENIVFAILYLESYMEITK